MTFGARTSSTRRRAGGPAEQGVERDLDAGDDRTTEVLALGADGVDGGGGAEVDDDGRTAVEVVGADGVRRCGRRRPPSGCRRGSACRCARRARARAPRTRSSARVISRSAAVTRGTPDAMATPVTWASNAKPWKPRNCWSISASSSEVRSAAVAIRQWSTSSRSPSNEPDHGLGVADVDGEQHRYLSLHVRGVSPDESRRESSDAAPTG